MHMMENAVVGSTRVGSRGQLVLPVKIRRLSGIKEGETLIVMARPGPGGMVVVLMRTSALADMLEHFRETGRQIRSLVKDAGRGKRPSGRGRRKGGMA